MPTPTERSLNALLSATLRIEKMLERKSDKPKDEPGSNKMINDVNKSFTVMTKSLETIEGETKKTNELLRELVNINNRNTKETDKETRETAKGLSKMGRGVNRLVKAVQLVGKLPDTAVDKFRSILMLGAFIDPKSGEPLAKDEDIERAKRSTKTIMYIVGGIALFGATLVLFSMVLPQIAKGVAGFSIVVGSLILTLWAVDKVVGKSKMPGDSGILRSLAMLGAGIALFGLTMILFSFAAPQIMAGAQAFVTVVATLTLSLFLMNIALSLGGRGLRDNSPLGGLMKLATGIATFAAIMVLTSYVIPQVARGAAGFILVIGALSLGIYLMNKALGNSTFEMGKMSKDGSGKSGGGRGPLGTLARLLFSIVVFSVSMVLISLVVQQFAVGTLAVVLGITALAGATYLLSFDFVNKGASNLRNLSISLLIFTGAMAAWAHLVQPKLTWDGLGMLGASIAGMGLVGSVLGVKGIDLAVKKGASNLIILAGALAAFSVGLSIYSRLAAPGLTWDNLAMLGAVIGTMGLIGGILGIPPVYVASLLGSTALIALGGALITLSLGLSVYKKSGFKEEDGKSLNSALRGIMAGFLGYESLDEVGVKALLKLPLVAGALLASTVTVGTAGLALIPLSRGLGIFKKVKWNEDDTKNLNSALSGVVDGFITAMAGINWRAARFGIKSMNNLGTALTGIAEGVQSFANLSFTEYEYDEKTGKMVPIRKVRLKPSDITETGKAIGSVLGALTEPISKFGDMMMGKGSGDSKKFSWGRVIAINAGIKAIGRIGSGIANLATGVQDWANMTITEWDVKTNKETGLPELVPVNRRKLENHEIDDASTNIGKVLGSLVKPLTDFGDMMDNSSKGGNIFQKIGLSKNGVERGVKAFSSVAGNLVSFAEGTAMWALMEVPQYDIAIDKETGLPVLVPAKPLHLGETELKKASKNIGHVLTSLVEPLSAWGDFMSGAKGGAFSKRANRKSIERGIESLGSISELLGNLATGVKEFAFMNFTKMKVTKDPKTGESVLTPDKVIRIGKDEIAKAGDNLNEIISISTNALVRFKKDTLSVLSADDVDDILNLITKSVNSFADVADIINKKWKDPSSISASDNFKEYLNNVASGAIEKITSSFGSFQRTFSSFETTFGKFSRAKDDVKFSTFTTNLIKLANHATDFEKFTKSFDKMAISMGKFSKNFNIFGPEGVKAFTTWTEALLKVTETSRDPGVMERLLQLTGKVTDVGLSVGASMTGGEISSQFTPTQQQEIINKTNEITTDSQVDSLVQIVSELRGVIGQLSSAIQGGIRAELPSSGLTLSIKGDGITGVLSN